MSEPPTSTPTLTDGVVTLRAHRDEDIDDVLGQGQDPEMQRWTTVPVPYQRSDAEFFVRELMPQGWQNPSGTRGFAIEASDGERPRFAGSIDFRRDGQAGVEVGFGLAPWARGRGLMTRAARLAVTWAFETLEVEVVLWRANVGNWASRRVAWALGFRFEGAVRAMVEARGQRSDAWVASLLRGDPMTAGPAWLEPVELTGGGVRLRPWRDGDEDRVVEAMQDGRIGRWLPRIPAPYTVRDARTFLLGERTRAAEASALGWCVADPADDRCLGSVDVFGLNRSGAEAEIGYWTHPGERGRGVMSHAVRLAVRHAVIPVHDGGLGQRRLTLRAAALNSASRRVAEAAGFREIGIERQVDPAPDGSFDDLVRYDLLAGEVTA